MHHARLRFGLVVAAMVGAGSCGDDAGTTARGTTRVGGLGTASGKMNYPVRVATIGTTAFVVECGNHRVQVFDGTGASLGMIGEGELFYPKGIATADTEVIVADSRNGRLVSFSGDTVNMIGSGALSAPCGIAVLDDSILVADPGLRQVVEIDRRGHILRRFGEGWILPWDVASDGSNVFVADASVPEMAVMNRNGRRTGTLALEIAPSAVSLVGGMLYVS